MTTQSAHGTSSDILVLGATGKTGRRLVARLRDKGTALVRAASRSGEVVFDWTLPGTWEQVLGEVTGLAVVEDRLTGVRLASGRQVPVTALAAPRALRHAVSCSPASG